MRCETLLGFLPDLEEKLKARNLDPQDVSGFSYRGHALRSSVWVGPRAGEVPWKAYAELATRAVYAASP